MKRTIPLFVVFALFVASAVAQDWRKIVPLKTKCEDLKILLDVKECQYPYSSYKFEKFNVSINFPKKNDKWNVSSDTVVNVTVIFCELMNLRDFETDISDYKITTPSDYDALIYTNDEKGISFETQKPDGNEELITYVSLFPPKTKSKPTQ